MRGAVIAVLLLLIPLAPLNGGSVVPQPHAQKAIPIPSLVPRLSNASRSGLTPNAEVNVFGSYTEEPAPMGIADYGIGPSGPYEYSTNSSLGLAGVVSLSTQNSTGSALTTAQLNVNLQFTDGGKLYVYWIQDVAFLNTANDLVFFVNNVWNFSSPTATMQSSGISGGGSVQPDGRISYYVEPAGAIPGNSVQLALPFVIELEVNATVSAGKPVVDFAYDDGFGLQVYDAVTFLTSGKVVMPGFVVDGAGYNPLGTFYDSELILAGPGNSLSTKDVSSDVRLELDYFNGHNYESVPNAYNFGSDTAESISNTLDQWYYIPSDGENIADLQPGAGTLGRLYDSSEVGTIVYDSSASSGTLEVQNSSDTSATPDQYPFVGGQATIIVYPGEYFLQLSENGVLTSVGTYDVKAGQTVTTSNQTNTTQLTLSYSVQGGGTGYSAPVLTYVLDGKQSTVQLTTTPTSYAVDIGSKWSVSATLPGSSSSGRWATDQVANGTASTAQTIQFLYQYQVPITVDYSIIGGGSPPAPELGYVSFSIPEAVSLTTSPVILWIDSGSSYSVPSDLASSSSNERWTTPTSSGVASTASSLTFAYYHQYFITPLYSVQGGGSGYGSPSITCSQLGSQTGVTEGSSTWADARAPCVYQAALPGSSQTTRWGVASSNVTVTGPGGVVAAYYYQYSLGISLKVVGGAPSIGPTLKGTAFGASTSITLSAASQTEWLDAGSPYSLSNPTPASTSSERWYTTNATSGTLTSGATVSLTYYHQYLVSALFSVIGGGSYTAPALSYVSFGNASSIVLTAASQKFWVDSGSHYSVPSLLGGSGATERWLSSSAAGTVKAAAALTFTYNHQFYLAVTGGALPSQWYNASSTATFSLPGVSGRESGSGERLSSYSIDNGSPTVVVPTTDNVTVSVVMDAAHTLSINFVTQYEVTLDSAISQALSSITPPTIRGDNYWYDKGTMVNLVLNGVWNRTSGAGERLTSYSLNGTPQEVSTTGSVSVQAGPISSPLSLTGTEVKEFSLTTDTGSVISVTLPSITGDTDWYDSGTQVTVVYSYSRNSSSGGRENALGYSVNGAGSPLPRAGGGTFPVQLTMNSAETVVVSYVEQYSLSVSGGYNLSFSETSPTGDGFYDSGSNLTITTDYTWGLVGGDERQNLVSFTLDSQTTNVTREQLGNFTTPSIQFNNPQTLSFNAVTQYLVAFQFKDSTGSTTITPTLVEIQLVDPTILTLPASGVWLDSGTRFQLYEVEWENADVKPANQTIYTADAPISDTITDMVYSATIVAKDYLGFPISGAQVSVTLGNGTSITRMTSSDGSVVLGEIPLGTYSGTVSYLGLKTSLSGDAATQPISEARLFASYPTFGIILLVAVALLAAVLVAVRRRQHEVQVSVPPALPAPAAPTVVEEPIVAETAGETEEEAVRTFVICPRCGTSNSLPADFCQNCGASLTSTTDQPQNNE